MTDGGFSARLNGRYDGMFRLDLVDRLREIMAQRDGWFLVAPGEPLPATPVSGADAAARLGELVAEILREERGVWTTMVYVQHQEEPEIVKVFHPRRAGCGCGASSGIRPWWVLSRIPPEPVPEWEQETVCAAAGGKENDAAPWWRRLV